jgi:phage shock protein PspC (stress-responsive transcriptional regulator)
MQVMRWNFRDMRKSAVDVQLGGVCGGLGEYSPVPSWIWRAGFLMLFLLFGCGAIAYGILWVTMPNADGSSSLNL